MLLNLWARVAPKAARIRKTVDETFYLSRPRRGAVLKEEVWQDEDGTVVRYSVAYLNPRICGVDNGRAIGYDKAHGYRHRHCMGLVEPVEFSTYEDLNIGPKVGKSACLSGLPLPVSGSAGVPKRVLCAIRKGIMMRLSMVTRSGLRTLIARGETALRAPTRKPGGGTR